MLATVRKLWAHLAWADETLLRALDAGTPSPEILREYAHILGADEIWLARLERRGLAHTLIGVTGDFVPAREVLNPSFLARMLV